MAQTTLDASFGPVFCPSRFPTLPALSSFTLALLLFVFSGRCCRCCVVVIEVSEEVVVVLVIDVVVDVVVVVVMPGCHAKYLHRIIFYGKYIFLYGSVVNCEYLCCTLMLTKSLVQSLYMTFFFHILSKHL